MISKRSEAGHRNFFLSVIIKPVDTNLGQFAVETKYWLDAWKMPRSVLDEQLYTILFYIHKLRIHPDSLYEVKYLYDYLKNNITNVQALTRHTYIYM